jgi:hypothetical protein
MSHRSRDQWPESIAWRDYMSFNPSCLRGDQRPALVDPQLLIAAIQIGSYGQRDSYPTSRTQAVAPRSTRRSTRRLMVIRRHGLPDTNQKVLRHAGRMEKTMSSFLLPFIMQRHPPAAACGFKAVSQPRRGIGGVPIDYSTKRGPV